MAKKFWFNFLMIFIILLTCCAVINAGDDKITVLTGDWQGSVVINDEPIKIQLDFTGDQKLTATISLPDKGPRYIPLQNVAFKTPAIHFELKDDDGSICIFNGQVAGDTIQGIMTESSLTANFTLKLINRQPKTPENSPWELGQHSYQSVVYQDKERIHKISIRYLLYLPDSYGQDPAKKWPLILFLHGFGERGFTPTLLKIHPLPLTLEQQPDFPFIVLSPQMPLDASWQNNTATLGTWWEKMVVPVLNLLDLVQIKYAVDPQRVYLTGISMGGFGTWRFALLYPERFAAIVPVAGGYSFNRSEVPQDIAKLRHLPIWVFHGDADTSVLPYQAEELVEALQKCGGNVKFTLYPVLGHDDTFFSKVYTNPELYNWLLQQKKK